MLASILIITLLLAAANGANDNIKGAATLFGSGVANYRTAITLATLATAAGGLASIYVAHGLLVAFSGKGIVPQDIATSIPFLGSVGLAAAVTVGIATRLGMPISTTHALLGGLSGAGFAAVASNVHLDIAFKEMLLPLLFSPVIALVLALAVVPLVRRIRTRTANAKACACIDVPATVVGETLAATRATLTFGTMDQPTCAPTAGRQVIAVDSARFADHVHLASAAAVSFARGLNDTPKIAALSAATGMLGASSATTLAVIAMAVGGYLAARRVADTMAFRITRMDVGQGLGANLVTSLLVIGASRFGMPVSTTHVASGALFGVAASGHGGHRAVIRNVVLAWLLTLPVAAVCAYLIYLLLTR
ncbi:MAG: inorganic phosphate transporter [Xanthomonadaceae bacterium]|nr:inorganic phosphate transporter [Xanthomonadaceae bacterium]